MELKQNQSEKASLAKLTSCLPHSHTQECRCEDPDQVQSYSVLAELAIERPGEIGPHRLAHHRRIGSAIRRQTSSTILDRNERQRL